jgi:glycerol-3-phosphate cytidylyltransferase
MIYCFDIDGTICSSVKNSDYLSAKCFPMVKELINQLYDAGNIIKIMTARGSVSGKDWTEITKKQLADWGIKYHELITNRKPNADLFVDDKAINIEDWLKKQNKITGLVAGCFDIIHPGYIWLFKDAKTVCNHLIVALHNDPSTERSHKFKPVNTIEDRKLILSSIKYIDEIVVYDNEDELQKLIQDIKPNYRILGSDYIGKQITGNIPDIKIHYHNRNHDWSYSSFRKKLKEII